MLKVKCKICGAITLQPYEFEGFFQEEPDTDKIYDGYCGKDCEMVDMDKIAAEHPENPNNIIKKYGNYTVTRESKIVCGADWQDQLKKTGRAGHEVVVTEVTLSYGTHNEVILKSDPRFQVAVKGCGIDD